MIFGEADQDLKTISKFEEKMKQLGVVIFKRKTYMIHLPSIFLKSFFTEEYKERITPPLSDLLNERKMQEKTDIHRYFSIYLLSQPFKV